MDFIVTLIRLPISFVAIVIVAVYYLALLSLETVAMTIALPFVSIFMTRAKIKDEVWINEYPNSLKPAIQRMRSLWWWAVLKDYDDIEEFDNIELSLIKKYVDRIVTIIRIPIAIVSTITIIAFFIMLLLRETIVLVIFFPFATLLFTNSALNTNWMNSYPNSLEFTEVTIKKLWFWATSLNDNTPIEIPRKLNAAIFRVPILFLVSIVIIGIHFVFFVIESASIMLLLPIAAIFLKRKDIKNSWIDKYPVSLRNIATKTKFLWQWSVMDTEFREHIVSDTEKKIDGILWILSHSTLVTMVFFVSYFFGSLLTSTWETRSLTKNSPLLIIASEEMNPTFTPSEWKNIQAHKEGICARHCLAFSPNGLFLLSGSVDKTMKLWDVRTGQAIRSFKGHTNAVLSVAYSPDGCTALSGSRDKTMKLWDVETGQAIRTFQEHTDAVLSVAYSSNGRTALSGSRDKTMKLWDVGTEQAIRSLEGHTGWVKSVVYSPDGRFIASGSANKTVKLWDVGIGQATHTFQEHNDAVLSVAYSPNGRTVLSGSRDKTMKLWDVETGQAIRTFTGHTDWVISVAFNPDGQFIASGSGDKTVKLWDVSSGKLIRTLIGHKNSVISVAFSPDGILASGDRDGVIKLWK